MDRIVERMVRQLTRALRTGDEATRLIVLGRLMAMADEPGFHRSFARAVDIVDTRP
jgi:hypothetical protein